MVLSSVHVLSRSIAAAKEPPTGRELIKPSLRCLPSRARARSQNARRRPNARVDAAHCARARAARRHLDARVRIARARTTPTASRDAAALARARRARRVEARPRTERGIVSDTSSHRTVRARRTRWPRTRRATSRSRTSPRVRRSSSRAPPRPRRASTRPPPRFSRAIADPTPTRRPSLLPPSSAPRASTDRLQVYPAGSPGVATDPHAEMGASLRSTPLRDPRASARATPFPAR